MSQRSWDIGMAYKLKQAHKFSAWQRSRRGQQNDVNRRRGVLAYHGGDGDYTPRLLSSSSRFGEVIALDLTTMIAAGFEIRSRATWPH